MYKRHSFFSDQAFLQNELMSLGAGGENLGGDSGGKLESEKAS